MMRRLTSAPKPSLRAVRYRSVQILDNAPGGSRISRRRSGRGCCSPPRRPGCNTPESRSGESAYRPPPAPRRAPPAPCAASITRARTCSSSPSPKYACGIPTRRPSSRVLLRQGRRGRVHARRVHLVPAHQRGGDGSRVPRVNRQRADLIQRRRIGQQARSGKPRHTSA